MHKCMQYFYPPEWNRQVSSLISMSLINREVSEYCLKWYMTEYSQFLVVFIPWAMVDVSANILITSKEQKNMKASNYFSTNFQLSFLKKHKTHPENLWKKACRFSVQAHHERFSFKILKNRWQLLIKLWLDSAPEIHFWIFSKILK